MQKIDGSARVCGILANPVEHSLSPLLHNMLAEILRMNRIYVPFKPQQDGLDMAVKGAYELNVLGLNVSVPYKQTVIKSLVDMEKAAAAIGAVNTLVRVNGGFKGYNTDLLGLQKAMKLEGIALNGEEIIMLGAGGVSKAAAYLCCQEGACRVYLLNRTFEKAKREAEELNTHFKKEIIIPMRLEEYGSIPARAEGYITFQTTSIGMYPESEKAVIEDETFYSLIHTAYDLIYTPFETKFMKLAKKAGAKTYNGLRMLLYQGVCAYELWNQMSVDEETVERCYSSMKEELGL